MASKVSLHKTDTEKVALAIQFKTEGNESHKKQDFKVAIGKYHRALLQLKGIGSAKSAGLGAFMSDEDMETMGYSETISETMKQDVTKLTADCYNNLSACLLKQPNPNYTKILEYCDKVIELEPQNAKAHYRKGLSYLSLDKYEQGLDSFQMASSLDSSFQASKYIQQCKEGIKKQDKQLRDAYKGMFDRQKSGNETQEHG
ncbi:tetratricopeptide repeat protein 9C-like [Mya arenaria]|uniref:tetratricopeptide repeat protein 9C-like n=1 Tax=Mya arenaria TaxID=6604 RepID=UPI0022E5F224|nr:tetratricopeptide repeat protein 9C-like [Mya arenaria]